MENSIIKRIKAMLLCGCVISLLFGCSYKGYEGDEAALYTVAINSIFGADECYLELEYFGDPYINVIEEDSSGRKLFSYRDRPGKISLAVIQCSDEEYAYYYPDFNYIVGYYAQDKSLDDMIAESFTIDEIEWLKQANDFNKPLDISKCVKSKVTRKKDNPIINSEQEKTISNLCKVAVEQAGYVIYSQGRNSMIYLTSDSYGRMLFNVHWYISIVDNNHKKQNKEFDFAMIFSADWSYNSENCVLLIEDMNDFRGNMQIELKKFKELNNWNQMQ